ncbi:MAG: extracellular solute-binding protein [Ruminococcaceae bacterium]|nr:extracellular solute-binding protein [Oscillospiraceae bacterium]
MQDFGGRTFNYMTSDMYIDDQYVEEATGDVYDDAIYNRNVFIETTFNVKLNCIAEPFTWAIRDEYMGKIRSSVMAGDGAYDIISQHSVSVGSMMGDNLFMNLNDVESLNLDADWWSKLIRDELTYKGKIYGMAGDISNNLLNASEVFFFNKQMMEEFQLEDPYQLVRDGKWTIDKLLEMITGTAQDLDGNSTMDQSDIWGMAIEDQQTYVDLITAFGMTYSFYEGDVRRPNVESETFLDSAELIRAMLMDNEDVLYRQGDAATTKVFPEGRALFYTGQLHYTDSFRELEFDYGILPPPKRNEAQENYYCTPRDSFVLYSIPTDVPDAEFAGAIMEALAVGGSEYIIPVFIDKVCNIKNVRDEDSVEMLELIRKNTTVDFAMVFSTDTGRVAHVICDAINNKKELTTYWAANKDAKLAEWEEFLKAYAGE